MQPPAEQPRPQKKGPSGCVIALLVVGVLGLVFLGIVSWGIYSVLTTEEAQAVMGMMGKAINAPGRKELNAAGCDFPMVMDLTEVSKLEGAKVPDPAETLIVTCSMRPKAPPPKCDDLAKVYVGAAPPTVEEFTLAVAVSGRQQPVCANVYNQAGERVRKSTLNERQRQPPPGWPPPEQMPMPESGDEAPH